MTDAPSPPWKLKCPWCDWYAWVSARGMHGADPGAGVEAALMGMRHAESHGHTWQEFVDAMAHDE